MSTKEKARDELARTLTFAKDLADPDWSLSVPLPAKDVIRKLVAAVEALTQRTITTMGELDALRTVGTVIEWGGRIYGAELAVPGDRPCWFGPGRATATTISPSADHPVTALHQPEASE